MPSTPQNPRRAGIVSARIPPPDPAAAPAGSSRPTRRTAASSARGSTWMTRCARASAPPAHPGPSPSPPRPPRHPGRRGHPAQPGHPDRSGHPVPWAQALSVLDALAGCSRPADRPARPGHPGARPPGAPNPVRLPLTTWPNQRNRSEILQLSSRSSAPAAALPHPRPCRHVQRGGARDPHDFVEVAGHVDRALVSIRAGNLDGARDELTDAMTHVNRFFGEDY